jgi:hypothetical protein
MTVKRVWRPREPAPPKQIEGLVPVVSSGISLWDAGNDQCRFVYGEPRALVVCGEKTLRGRGRRSHVEESSSHPAIDASRDYG